MLPAGYLQNTKSVLQAGRHLRSVMGGDQVTINEATKWLQQAAQEQEQAAVNLRKMFEASEAKAPAEEKPDAATFAGVLADVQVASTLIAAGQALGETGQANPKGLDEALLRLDHATRAIEAGPAVLGFAEEVTHSADLPEAVETFRSRTDTVLTTLVTEARSASGSVLTALSKVDEEKVLSALSGLGLQVQAVPRIGRLFRMGVEKLEKAFDFLIRLLGSDALRGIKDKAEEIWNKAKKGEYTDDALKFVFGIQGLRSLSTQVMASEHLKKDSVDGASDRLSITGATFKEKMTWARDLAAAVGFAGSILLLTPVSAPSVAVFTASAYLLILAAILLIGRDYAGSGRLLQPAGGVKLILEGLLS